MNFWSKINLLVWLGILSGCSKTGSHHNGSGGGAIGENNFNSSPAPLGAGITVYNACSVPMWIMALQGATSGSGTVVVNSEKLSSGERFLVSPMAAGKIWAKFGCDRNGQNCAIGDQLTSSQPPIDTGFEFTYGPLATGRPNEWYYNFSAVDGFTSPMRLIPVGGGTGCNEIFTTNFSVAAVCPNNEILNTPTSGWSVGSTGVTPFGNFTTYYVPTAFKAQLGDSIDLSAPRSLVYTANGKTLGCVAPGKFLTTPPPYGLGIAACSEAQCDARNSPQDIDINGAQAATYDARVVMYANPYTGCDLTSDMSGTQQTTVPPLNCANGASIQAHNVGLIPANQGFFTNLGGEASAFCFSPANANASLYCNDQAAASGGGGTALKPSTAASNMSRLGPIVSTKYVQNVHTSLPTTYAYQYDDADALQTCQNVNAQLVLMIGCPNP